MPINYKQYHPDWLTKIRPAILERAKNCCENCGVQNHRVIYRGFIQVAHTRTEVYQDNDGRVYDANNSKLLFKSLYVMIEPLDPKRIRAFKVVLTISHQDHDINNNDPSNLKAPCQRCHNRHDGNHRGANRRRKTSPETLFAEV